MTNLMFGIGATPFDVRLVAFGIPIRVHPTFWLGTILFGSELPTNQLIFIWVCTAFVSILVHELGHALTAESFGWPTEIVMFFGGGVALSQQTRRYSLWKSITVSLMGPIAGFLLLGVLILAEKIMHVSHREVLYHLQFEPLPDTADFYFKSVLYFLWIQNLYWGLFNLIPVLPLDGGHVLESLCIAMRFRDPTGIVLKVGAAASGIAAYLFFTKFDFMLPGMLMLILCIQSISALQSRQ
ncbi:metalloprotease [Schlesneria sp. DSM 10557]|uniref:metalloprotease n=1 Tax=Schlesneria sp. DSM 10557 TaxID=3044399 RepID=UPI0035A0D77E